MRYFPLFVGIFLVTFASLAIADSNLDANLTSSSLSGSHNSAISGSFTLKNLNPSTNIVNLTCTAAISGQSWTASCNPSQTTINANGSQTGSFSVTVPQFASPTSYSGTLSVSGVLSTGTAVSDSKSFTLVVSETPSYSISWTVAPSNLYQGQNKTVSFNVTNDGNIPLTTSVLLDLGTLNTSSFSKNYSVINPQSSFADSVNLQTSDDTHIGKHMITLSVTGTGNKNTTVSSSQSFDVIFPFCEDVLVKNLTSTPIVIDEVKNEKKFSGKDFEPLDTIEIEVKIENRDKDDSVKAVAEAVLIFEDGKVDDADDEVKVKIKKDDIDTATLKILIPADIKEGKHLLYLKVYNDDDELNCQQKVYEIEIEKNNRDVVPYKVELPSEVTCGETFTFSGKVVNIGNDDEEKVSVILKAFGKLFEDTFKNLDEGDFSSLFNFNVEVPKDVSGSQRVVLDIGYDYDEDDESYDESEAFSYSFNVVCRNVGGKAEFRTETSVALIDTESDVRVLLVNSGSAAKTFSVSADAGSWGKVNSVSPSTLTLKSGDQQYLTIKVTPNKDTAIGSYNLVLTSTSDGETEALNVPVNVQKSSKGSSLLEKAKFSFGSNPVWVVLNAVLVLAIIAVLFLIFSGNKKSNLPKKLYSALEE